MNNQKLMLPAGKAVYPHLNTPDRQFDELGTYQSRIAVPVEEAKGVMETISAMYQSHTGKKINPSDNTCWKLEEDDNGDRTGNVLFKVKAKNRRTRDGAVWDRAPRLVDASLKPTKARVGGGSLIKVGCELFAWDAAGKKGLSLQPRIVQIIQLVEDGGVTESFDDFGMKAEQGFAATDASEPEAEVEEYTEVEDHDDF